MSPTFNLPFARIVSAIESSRSPSRAKILATTGKLYAQFHYDHWNGDPGTTWGRRGIPRDVGDPTAVREGREGNSG